MNKAAFLNIVRQVAPIEDQEVEDLERLVVTFPYCQTAHVLLAKAAHDRGSMLSNQKLRKAAAHVSNRQLLKRLVYAPPIIEETPAPVALEEVPVAEETEQLTAVTSPELLSEQIPVQETEAPTTSEFVENFIGTEDSLVVDEPIEEAEVVTLEADVISELETSEFSEDIEIEEPAHPVETELVYTEEEANNLVEEPSLDSEITEVETQLVGNLLQVDLFTNTPVLPQAIQEEEIVEAEPFSDIQEISEDEVSVPIIDSGIQTEETTVAPFLLLEQNNEETPVTSSTSEEDELLDLIHIDSLSTLTTAPYPSVNLSHAEIVSNIVTTSETAFYNQEGKVSLEEVMALAAADRELEDLPSLEDEQEIEPFATTTEIPEDQLFPWETPGYQIPTLQYDLLSHPEPLESAPVSADAYTNILSQNSLAYWMDSSRMGESLQLRDELTSSTPFYFQPELILEHVKGNGRPDPEPVPVQNNRLDQQLNIIDQFLKASPKLKSVANSQWKDEPIEDLSAKSSKIKKSLASENLAQIYIKQGKGRKAIKIYEQLIVKYPEKKGYFAEQIEKLRNEL